MNREDIIHELKNRGYDPKEIDVVKNSVSLQGIRLDINKQIDSIIYTENLINDAKQTGKTVSDVVDEILEVHLQNNGLDFDITLLQNKEYVLNRLYLSLQRKSDENLVYKDCNLEGMACFIYFRGHEKTSNTQFIIKVTPNILTYAGISIEKAIQYAEKNTFSETIVMSMHDISTKMFGIPEECAPEDDINGFYVVTNRVKMRGAAAILDQNALREYGKKVHTNKIIAIPSSIHEWLIMPYTNDINLASITEMIQHINSIMVDPVDQLGDHPLILNIE